MNTLDNQDCKHSWAVDAEALLKRIALCCKQTIIEPKTNLTNLLFVFDQKDVVPNIVLVSLLRVFLEIIPLYQIKQSEHIVRDGQQKSKLEKWEEELLMLYQKYVGLVVAQTAPVNFVCACRLVTNLSHFNFLEKLVAFILKGTAIECVNDFSVDNNSNGINDVNNSVDNNNNIGDYSSSDNIEHGNSTSIDNDYNSTGIDNDSDHNSINNNININKICLNTIESIFKSTNLQLQYKILTAMSELHFGRNVLSCIIHIDIHSYQLVKDSFYTGFIYEKEKSKNKAYNSKYSHTMTMSKTDKKEEKIRRRLEIKKLEEEGVVNEEKQKKLELKICNMILKIFLLVLKNRREEYYEEVLTGIRVFKVIVKPDLLVGTKQLILECVTNQSPIIMFLGILAIITLYENKTVDLNKVKQIFYTLLNPFTITISDSEQKLIVKTLKVLFLHSKQPNECVHNFIRRLMVLCSLNYYPSIGMLIHSIAEHYEIDDYKHMCVESSVYSKMYY